jgi:hypothetical protein
MEVAPKDVCPWQPYDNERVVLIFQQTVVYYMTVPTLDLAERIMSIAYFLYFTQD